MPSHYNLPPPPGVDIIEWLRQKVAEANASLGAWGVENISRPVASAIRSMGHVPTLVPGPAPTRGLFEDLSRVLFGTIAQGVNPGGKPPGLPSIPASVAPPPSPNALRTLQFIQSIPRARPRSRLPLKSSVKSGRRGGFKE